MGDQKIAAGTYRGRGIAGSEQYGSTSNGNDQIVIDLDLPDIGEQVSTFLVFSDKAAPYAIQRLRALGWQGSDLSNLDGIDANEVDVEIRYEMYKGEEKMKVEIRTGGGRVQLQNTYDEKSKRGFAAKYAKLCAGAPAPTNARPAQDDFPPGYSNAAPPRRAGGIGKL